MNLAGFVDAEGSAVSEVRMGQQLDPVVEVRGDAIGGVRVDGVDARIPASSSALEGMPLPGFDRSSDEVPSSRPAMKNGISHPGFELGYDSWDPTPQLVHAEEENASGWDDPRPAPVAQPATEGWDSVRPHYGWDAPRPVASGGEW